MRVMDTLFPHRCVQVFMHCLSISIPNVDFLTKKSIYSYFNICLLIYIPPRHTTSTTWCLTLLLFCKKWIPYFENWLSYSHFIFSRVRLKGHTFLVEHQCFVLYKLWLATGVFYLPQVYIPWLMYCKLTSLKAGHPAG